MPECYKRIDLFRQSTPIPSPETKRSHQGLACALAFSACGHFPDSARAFNPWFLPLVSDYLLKISNRA